MTLTSGEEALLRKLVLRGSQAWDGVDRQALGGLQVLGYARRSGAKGTGRWVEATKRGVLKALERGIIDHHPDDPEPFMAMLKKDRVAQALAR